ncbi:MAG: 3-dehydroquinate synthase [Pirellulales bacterium]
MKRDELRVELGERSYTICIAGRSLDELGAVLSRHGATRAAVIFDERVEAYAERVAASGQQHGLRVDRCSVPSGEASKCAAEAERLWGWLADQRVDRQTVVVAVGGGVVGDLAGFVAATYARGLAFCQVPTTLLAQVDSSVGGKVGINLPQAKNMVGAFWQPVYVAIDPLTLASLPAREYRSGLAEVVKYGVILDADFFAQLEQLIEPLRQRDPEVLTGVIRRCCELKAEVVQQDERETTGLRAVLNYGHTFAHAFEALCGYGHLLHGEAVSIGMLCASRLAERLGRIPAELTERQHRLLAALELPTDVPSLDPQEVIACMATDKKVEHGRLRFVLPDRLGHVELVSDISSGLVLEALRG